MRRSMTAGGLQLAGLLLAMSSLWLGGTAVVDPACVSGHYLIVHATENPGSGEVIAYENLSETEQRLFDEARAEGSVRVQRAAVGELADAVVAYRGTRYRSTIAQQDCGSERELKVVTGVAGVLIGSALFASGRGWVPA